MQILSMYYIDENHASFIQRVKLTNKIKREITKTVKKIKSA